VLGAFESATENQQAAVNGFSIEYHQSYLLVGEELGWLVGATGDSAAYRVTAFPVAAESAAQLRGRSISW